MGSYNETIDEFDRLIETAKDLIDKDRVDVSILPYLLTRLEEHRRYAVNLGSICFKEKETREESEEYFSTLFISSSNYNDIKHTLTLLAVVIKDKLRPATSPIMEFRQRKQYASLIRMRSMFPKMKVVVTRKIIRELTE